MYLRGTREEPLRGGAGDEHFENQQPSAVDERGNVGWAWPCSAGGARGQADGQQCHSYPGGVQEIVAAFCQHRERVRRDAHGHQGGHEAEVEHEHNYQALRTGQLRRSYGSAFRTAATCGNRNA